MLHLRPHNRFEDLDGVYLVGGGTHPGSGLPVIFESARISSRLVLEDLGINGGRSATPSQKQATHVTRAFAALADAMQSCSSLINLKPTRVDSNQTPKLNLKP
jgi:hypothetical protein